MRRSKPFYILGLLIVAIIFMLAAFFCFTGFAKNWREEQEKKFWRNFFESIDWENFPFEDFPWADFPFDSFENFPWDQIPWEELPWDQIPEEFPWDEIPWETLPWGDISDGFPWENIPWEDFPFDELPDDFPWTELPWDEMPDDFPWNDVPWGDMPWDDMTEEFPWDKMPWEDFPMDELPDDFPWDQMPWDDMPDDFPYGDVPWDELPEDFPWSDIPYDDLPEDFPWSELPVEDLPEDFPWSDLPYDDMPEDFPWEDLPIGDLPPDFPWEKVPWDQMPEDYWETFPWEDLPEDFPWYVLPWIMINPDLLPDGVLPDDFYPEDWNHEHQFATDIWLTIVPPTCGTPGQEQNICIICRQVITREIPPTGNHRFGDDGICEVCGMHRLILQSEGKVKEYDGSPLDGYCELSFGEGSAGLMAGHYINYAAITFAKCTVLGKVTNVFRFEEDVVVVDGEGNNVTDNYKIEVAYGTLVMTQRKITITTEGATAAFEDIDPDVGLKNEKYNVDGLLYGHKVTDVVFGEGQKDYGSRENEILSFNIVDENGEDVSKFYSVEFEFGWLTVN